MFNNPHQTLMHSTAYQPIHKLRLGAMPLLQSPKDDIPLQVIVSHNHSNLHSQSVLVLEVPVKS